MSEVAAGTPASLERGVAAVMRATARRPLTVAEARAKLVALDLQPEHVEEALRRLAAVRAVDDRAFATAWVADRGARRGYGASRLRQELRRRQVPEELIEGVLAELAEERDEADEAVRLARERWARLPASLEPDAAARRIVGFLVRRGYPPGLAERAARKATRLDEPWD